MLKRDSQNPEVANLSFGSTCTKKPNARPWGSWREYRTEGMAGSWKAMWDMLSLRRHSRSSSSSSCTTSSNGFSAAKFVDSGTTPESC